MECITRVRVIMVLELTIIVLLLTASHSKIQIESKEWELTIFSKMDIQLKSIRLI